MARMKSENSNNTSMKKRADHAAPSDRIRDNQRRSRARRKEYIQDLEQRLRRFEGLGVEATHGVQAAGRKVAAENILLRSLLRLHGVVEKEIEEYLISQTQSATPTPTHFPFVIASGLAIPRPRTVRSHPLVNRHPSQTSPYYPKMNNPLHEQDAVGASASRAKSVIGHAEISNGQDSHAERPAAVVSVTPEDVPVVRLSGGKQDTGQLTSCEAAASIIATMRYYPDLRDARSQLGCYSESNCMVKNLAIFDLLDR